MIKIQRPPLLASLCALIGICILCTLGTWQVQRLTWKTELLHAIESENQKDVRNFQITADMITHIDNPNFFLRGTLVGKFLYNREILLGPKTHQGKFAHLVITPLKLQETDQHILVVRGWIPENAENELVQINSTRQAAQWISGYLIQPKPNMFLPENNPDTETWNRLDIQEIAAHMDIQKVAPVLMYAQHASYANDALPKLGTYYTPPSPNNNHLQYAAFWFSMAGVLGIIFILRFIIVKKNTSPAPIIREN